MNDRIEGSGNELAKRLGLSRTKPKRRIPKWLWWAGSAAVAIGLGFFLFAQGGAKPLYVTQSVSRGPLTLSVSATGTLAPRVQVDVGAEVSGRIDELFVDYNDHVTKGQKLAQINTDQIQAQLDQARATLMQARATLMQTEARARRYAALLKTNALSRQDYDTAVADYERAKGGVASGAAQVQQYETMLTKATIYSPIDGVVLDRKVSRGQTVVASFNTPVLYTIASDLRQMELDVDIDEADVGAVRAGQQAFFTVDAYPDRKFSARLITVHNASQTVQNVVTYRGVLLVDNSSFLLRPGMTATAEILTGRIDDALLVPNAALRFVPAEDIVKKASPIVIGAGNGRVWTVGTGNQLTAHDLKLGGSNGLYTVVTSGDLKPGDKVVTEKKTQGGSASVTVGG